MITPIMLRFAVPTTLGFALLIACVPVKKARAQNEGIVTVSGSTIQTISPTGVVFTLSDNAAQIITPDGEVITTAYVKGQAPFPASLGKALDKVFWEPDQRGPLIAVAPENIRPAWQTAARKPRIGPDGNYLPLPAPSPPELLPGGSYRATEVADFFGQRIVRLKGLSAVAPLEMVALNTKLGKPDYFADLRRDKKMRLLQASLTAAQWKRLGSDEGLGTDDLSANQRDLFLSILPDPMRIRRQRTGATLSFESSIVVLSGGERSGVRLRLNRVAQYSVPMEGEAGFRYPLSSEAEGTEYGTLISYEEDSRDKLFGQKIRTTLPNRLKPQQIDFTSPALQAAIPLVGLKTVGDLVERIRTTSHVPLYVDGRVANRTLWIRAKETQTAVAGEALQALCWSLSGAVRAVSSGPGPGPADTVYILTEDVAGFGSRLAVLKDWAQAAQQHAYEAEAALGEAIAKQQPIQYIGFAAGDPSALNEKATKTVENNWQTIMGRYQGAMLPLSDLSPQQQELVKQGIAAYDKQNYTFNGEHRNLVNNGTVSVSVQIRASLIVPNVGEVRISGVDINSLLPPAKQFDQNPAAAPPKLADTAHIPESMPLGGVLCVSPETEEEAAKAVRSAREQGLKQVWIVLPIAPAAAVKPADMSRAKALLAAATTEARKERPVPQILPGVRLFSVPASPGDPLPTPTETQRDDVFPKDVAVTGGIPIEVAQNRVAASLATESDPTMPQFYLQLQHTRDWVPPNAPGLNERLRRTLADVARIPGISGLALLDTAPPGYCMPSARYGVADSIIPVGYTPANRVAFIRTAGFDPVDITSPFYAGSMNFQLSFFQENQGGFQYEASPQGVKRTDSVSTWNAFRSDIVSKALADLYGPLTATLPKRDDGFPVYIESLDTATTGSAWFSRWEKRDALPKRDPAGLTRNDTSYLTARKASTVSLLETSYRDYPTVSSRSTFAPPVTPPVPVTPTVQFARSVNALLTYKKGAWSGLVLNFSAVSVDKALEVIAGVSASEKKPATERGR